MPVCKIKKILTLAISLSSFAYAQQNGSLEMPSMPDFPSGPSMPDISSPVNSNFYSPVYQNSRQKPNSQSKDSKTSETAQTQSTNESASKQQIIQNISASTLSDYLSASDLNSMNQNGLLSGVYNLLGTQTSGNTISTTSTEQMLQTILTELESLKKSSNTQTSPSSQNKTVNLASRPSILRFTVNGYNVLETCRSVYFSQREADGTFLLTADRKYTSENKTRNETFYLLFKADGNCGSQIGYNVSPSVVQDYPNEYSFLYQLTNKKNLKASKTGNLVVLKVNSEDWNMDLLLDIGE